MFFIVERGVGFCFVYATMMGKKLDDLVDTRATHDFISEKKTKSFLSEPKMDRSTYNMVKLEV